MSKHISNAVDSFKSENGNNTFTTKELVMYVIKRLDDLPCNKEISRITQLETTIHNMKYAITIALLIIGAVIAIIELCMS